MTDIRQSPQYARYMEAIGWRIERIGRDYCYIKKIPIIGSVIKIQRPEDIGIRDLKMLSKKYRPFQIIYEPNLLSNTRLRKFRILIAEEGFRLSRSPYLPTKTLQLDITRTRDFLLKNTKKDCRNAIKRTKNSIFSRNPDLKSFHASWMKSVGIRHYVPPIRHLLALKKAFRNNSLFLASHNEEGEITSGAVFLLSEKRTYYWYAFNSKEGRSTLSQYRLVWEGILWGKRRGARIFDFEGVYDPRFPLPSWKGFTHFKKSFGGHEVEYPGCFLKTNPFSWLPKSPMHVP